MDFQNFCIDKDYLLKINNNVNYNKIIVSYYDRLYKELSEDNYYTLSNYLINGKISKYDTIRNVRDRVGKCNKYWLIDRYDYLMVKDFKSTNLCHDKFCNNCKKVKQACRMSRYMPYIEEFKDDLYHITLTVPNCSGADLNKCISIMYSAFTRLVRILDGRDKYSNVFGDLGYLGSIRSLEITFKGDSYHPHLHCAFAFTDLDVSDKNNKNVFSYSKKNGYRYFSDFEIKLQKVWYCLINGLKLTKKNIEDSPGYSCIVDKFRNDDYMELFKYMTKSTNEDDKVLSYSNFKALYFGTYRKKQIQGYGCFYKITDDSLEDEIDKVYLDIQNLLNVDESVEEICKVSDLLYDDNYMIISRKQIYQYLKNLD